MIATDFDEGSFKKARSFSLAFASLVLVLWYFKAELSTLSILGNSVKFTANQEHAWLLLAIVNTYLFFRLLQHLPERWSKQPKAVEEYFESSLIMVLKVIARRENRRVAIADLKTAPGYALMSNIRVHSEGQMAYHVYDPATGETLGGKRSKAVLFILPVSWKTAGSEGYSTGVTNKITPSMMVVAVCRLMASVRGVLFAPWFTEYVFPMLYAASATTVALVRWLG